MAFPLSPIPSYYATCSQTARNGIWYEGENVSIALSKSGATSHEVRDYYGNVVASGPVSGTTINLGSSLPLGWYRIYGRGASTDSLFGESYFVTNFCVIPEHPGFRRLPTSVGGYYGGYVPSGTGDSDQAAGNPGNPDWGNNFDSPVEMITRACLGLGIGRLSILGNGASDPNGGSYDRLAGNASFAENVLGPWWLNPDNEDYADPVRERMQFIAFPNLPTWDYIALPNDGSQPSYISWANVYPKDASVDGDKVFVTLSAGTVSGAKLTISYPDSATVAETYDNLANGSAAEAATTSSAYVKLFSGGSNTAGTLSATAIGTSFRAGISETVATLYPLGITRFEGPYNEPQLTAQVAHQMMLFAAAVHDGHPDAKAIGPCPVSITNLGAWSVFAAAGGLDHCDEISFHDYNTCVAGDVNQARNNIRDFLALLRNYGAGDKLLWQTEANHAMTSVGGDPALGGVYCPRRSRVPLMRILLWEQYGIPFERQPLWYDWSHGFWSYASFMFLGYGSDKSANPWVPLIATLARETFRKSYHHAIDFGSKPANDMFIGNVYGNSRTGSVAVVSSISTIPDASVTFQVEGTTSPLVTVDAFGNESTVTITDGRCTVDARDVPTYVRLPEGVNVWVYSVNDWGHAPNVSVSAAKSSAVLGGVSMASMADGDFMGVYTGYGTTQGVAFSSIDPPDVAELKFASDVEIERVIVWAGPAYQFSSVLADYDVDTWDGFAWTTRKTVTKTIPPSFLFGASSSNTGTKRDSYWDEQWIEDVKLDTPVTARGVRLSIRAVSFGGMPDIDAAATVTAHGDGTETPRVTIQEIAVISPTAVASGASYVDEVLADSPRGYWRMNETAGTSAADSSGNNLAGTYSASGVTYSYPGAISDGDTAVALANSQSITVPDNNLFDVGDTFSLECWFFGTHVSFSGQTIGFFSKGNNNFVFGAIGGTFPVASAKLRLYKQQTNEVIALSTATFNVGSWNHCVCTKNGSSVHLYLNGQDVTGSVSDRTLSNTSTALTIGGGGQGAVDEAAVYATALSAERVLAHYVAGIRPAIPANTLAPQLEVTA